MKTKLVLVCVLCLSVTGTADAQLYRWVDDKGGVHYSDTPPPGQSPPAATRPSAEAGGDDFFAGTIKYMDHLKTCTPHTFSYPHPLIQGFTGQNIIKGRRGDKCVVTYVMPGNMTMDCEFSQGTIALMTSPAKYQEARRREMSGSSSDPASQKMQEECVPR